MSRVSPFYRSPITQIHIRVQDVAYSIEVPDEPRVEEFFEDGQWVPRTVATTKRVWYCSPTPSFHCEPWEVMPRWLELEGQHIYNPWLRNPQGWMRFPLSIEFWLEKCHVAADCPYRSGI